MWVFAILLRGFVFPNGWRPTADGCYGLPPFFHTGT